MRPNRKDYLHEETPRGPLCPIVDKEGKHYVDLRNTDGFGYCSSDQFMVITGVLNLWGRAVPFDDGSIELKKGDTLTVVVDPERFEDYD